MKKSKLFLVLMLMMCLALVFTGCSKDKPAEPADKPAETTTDKPAEATTDKPADISLSDWAGSWNNMGWYLDDKELEPAFKTLAEKENKTEAEVKDAYVAKRACDFNGMKIEGDKVMFLDAPESENGKVTSEAVYKYEGSENVKHGNFDLEWHVFKAEGDAKYPVLLLMDVHGEEALTHFHMRYGSDKDELMKKEGWFPTFVKPDSTYDQLTSEITE